MNIYTFKEEDARRFASENGFKTRRKGDELIFKECPYCHSTSINDKEKFSINLRTGRFHCWRASCGAKGNMLTLAKDFNFSLGNTVDEYYTPRTFRTFKAMRIEVTDPAVKYMQSRGISKTVTEKYRVTESEGNLVFPFLDQDGSVAFIKYRNPNPKPGQNKEWCEANCKPILFGMHQCNPENDTLIITEGQIDSLSVSEAGFENAVSVPTGANGFTWVPYCWDWMNKFKRIIVFGDHEHGHITLYKEISSRWDSKVWHVREEDYLDCKDANEILQKYGRSQIRKCIGNAVQKPIAKARDLSTVEYINPDDIEKLPTGIQCIDDVLHGGVPFGQLLLITGKAGDGKSTFASQILLSALDNNCKCFAYSGELPNSLFKSWMDHQAAGPNDDTGASNWERNKDKLRLKETALAKIKDWYKGSMWVYDNELALLDDEEPLTALLERVINQYGVRVILIDNLMTALDLEPIDTSEKYERQSLFMKKMARLALRYNILIILVAHKRKNNGNSDVNDSVSGTADISNLASVVMSYERGSKEDTDDVRRLKISKNRLYGTLTGKDGLELKYEPLSKRIYVTEDEKNRWYSWETNEMGMKEVDSEPLPFGNSFLHEEVPF